MTFNPNKHPMTTVHGRIACLPEFWSTTNAKRTFFTRRSLGRRSGVDANFKFNPKRINPNEKHRTRKAHNNRITEEWKYDNLIPHIVVKSSHPSNFILFSQQRNNRMGE